MMQKLRTNVRFGIAILAIFYTVGIFGLTFEFSRQLFIQLIPFNLMLSAAFLYFYQIQIRSKHYMAFFSVFIFSWFVEFMGTTTGLLFGEYVYLHGFGLKIFNTPIIIGLNWFLLSYGIWSVFGKLKINTVFQIISASSVMVFFDFFLEPSAIRYQMWQWTQGSIPVLNYIAWFVVSAFIFLFYKLLKINTNNQIAFPLVVIQFIFFLSLFILNL